MNYKKISQRIKDAHENPFKGLEGDLKQVAGDFDVELSNNAVHFSKGSLRWYISYEYEWAHKGGAYEFHYGSVPSYGTFNDDSECKDLYALVGRVVSSDISKKVISKQQKEIVERFKTGE